MHSLVVAIDGLLQIGNPVLIAVGHDTPKDSSLQCPDDSIDRSQTVRIFLVLELMQDFVLVEKRLEGSSEFYTVVRVQPTWGMFAFQDLLKGIRHCIAAVGSQGLCVDFFAEDVQHNQNIPERLFFFWLLGCLLVGCSPVCFGGFLAASAAWAACAATT